MSETLNNCINATGCPAAWGNNGMNSAKVISLKPNLLRNLLMMAKKVCWRKPAKMSVEGVATFTVPDQYLLMPTGPNMVFSAGEMSRLAACRVCMMGRKVRTSLEQFWAAGAVWLGFL